MGLGSGAEVQPGLSRAGQKQRGVSWDTKWAGGEIVVVKQDKSQYGVPFEVVANKELRDCPYILKHPFQKGLQDIQRANPER